MKLILLATENCNFRCKCYSQSFARNGMSKAVIAGIERYVRSQASRLDVLTIGWFGGEPLTAPVIREAISAKLQANCAEHGIEYSSSMTTNGYLMTPAVLTLLAAEVRRFSSHGG